MINASAAAERTARASDPRPKPGARAGYPAGRMYTERAIDTEPRRARLELMPGACGERERRVVEERLLLPMSHD